MSRHIITGSLFHSFTIIPGFAFSGVYSSSKESYSGWESSSASATFWPQCWANSGPSRDWAAEAGASRPEHAEPAMARCPAGPCHTEPSPWVCSAAPGHRSEPSSGWRRCLRSVTFRYRSCLTSVFQEARFTRRRRLSRPGRITAAPGQRFSMPRHSGWTAWASLCWMRAPQTCPDLSPQLQWASPPHWLASSLPKTSMLSGSTWSWVRALLLFFFL